MFYEQQAQELFDRLMEQRAVCEGITEDLKASDQMDWTGRMNVLRNKLIVQSRYTDIVDEVIIKLYK